MGFKGVYITRTCFRDCVIILSSSLFYSLALFLVDSSMESTRSHIVIHIPVVKIYGVWVGILILIVSFHDFAIIGQSLEHVCYVGDLCTEHRGATCSFFASSFQFV